VPSAPAVALPTMQLYSRLSSASQLAPL